MAIPSKKHAFRADWKVQSNERIDATAFSVDEFREKKSACFVPDVGTSVRSSSEGMMTSGKPNPAAREQIERIVAQYRPLIYSVCRRYLRRPDDVEDAAQETALKVI